jgi:hypothetical protein
MEKFISDLNSLETNEAYSELLNIVQQIDLISESKRSREQMISELKPLIKEFLNHLQTDLHWELSSDVTSLYNEMSKEDLLARVGSIKRAINCLAKGSPIVVGVGEDHYANSVTTDVEGLRIAMAEATSIGPVRLLMGLDLKAMIGFTKEHLSVKEISDNEFDLRDTNLRKVYCRHIDGEIHKEDIKYVVMRIPKHLFPQEELSPEELKTPSQFVFRGVKLESPASQVEELPLAA